MADVGEEPDSDAAKPKLHAGGSSVPSADKRWEVRGTIAAAAITAIVGGIVAVVVALINRPSPDPDHPGITTTSTAAFLPPTGQTLVPAVSIGQVAHIKGDLGLTITGKVDVGNAGVFVTVGPRPNNKPWAAQADVRSDGTWTATIDTPPKLPDPYVVKAYRVPAQPWGDLGASIDQKPKGAREPESCRRTDLLDPVCLDALGGPVAVYSGKISSPQATGVEPTVRRVFVP